MWASQTIKIVKPDDSRYSGEVDYSNNRKRYLIYEFQYLSLQSTSGSIMFGIYSSAPKK